MNYTHTLSLLFSFFLVLNIFNFANAFNITKLLEQYSDFSTFNNYLTQTQLAGEINSRQTITVLVVDNDNISPISGKPVDLLKQIMSVHVILDYYDVKKLQSLPNKTSILTTLFQSSGTASGELGFLNVTDLSTGSVAIGSADKGATLGATLVKSIAAQPYNVSVLQISTIIIPLGIENSKSNSSSNSTSPPSPVTAASPGKSETPTPAKSPATAPPKSSKAPAPSDAASDAPSNAEAPTKADTPSAAPGSPPVPDAPTAGTPAADAPAADNSSPSVGTAIGLGLGGVVMIILSTLCLTVMN
ncbi:unnamed protein product [Ilex paraguariensis]|uniref:FAS1 domain-containing protein n=1 Tax=Ilex paraguariensis TaxID=185542 RepID=A0ABC8V0R8_9AQUA